LIVILFAIAAAAVFLSDKYYYFNDENVRYTVGKYKDKIYFVGRSSEMTYRFTYLVEGKQYIALTTKDMRNIEGLPVIIKYSAVDPDFSDVLKVVVPSWVLSPPKDGWKEYPPDINWEGAVLDTLYMQKLREERKK
jgi:hypothetical protein